jgi:hypothetical protein
MSRLLLIPCAHFNREGEAALRACYLLRSRYPRKILIVTPPTIGASSLLLSSFGVDPKDHVAVNGCALECVNKILKKECATEPGHTIDFEERFSPDASSALSVDDDIVQEYARRLEILLAAELRK